MSSAIQKKTQTGSSRRRSVIRVILNLLVLGVAVVQFTNGNYANVFLCALTLLLFLIPSFVDRRLGIRIPAGLEVIILLFIFAAEILGEIQEYYLHFAHWDTMLHTMNGFLMAAIGFAMIDILNRHPRFHFSLSPVFVAFVAFCFSMTIGVLWEFFEFGMDSIFKTDMQKDTVVTVVSSVMLNPAGANEPVRVSVDSLAVNGEIWNFGGYLDIGLIDTMHDLLVNCLGALVFSIFGALYLKGKSRGAKVAESLIPSLKTPEEIQAEQAAEQQRRAAAEEKWARRKAARRKK